MFVSTAFKIKFLEIHYCFCSKVHETENFPALSRLLGGPAVGAGFGRRLGNATERLYEGEGVLAVPSFCLSAGW